MSVHVSSWVWKYSKAKDHQLLVLLTLADMANDEGVCWPSIRTICQRCRISERSAQVAVKIAAGNGEIIILPQSGPHSVNVYQFTAFAPAKSAPPQNLHPASLGKIGVQNTTKPPAKSAPKSSESSKVNVNNNSVDPRVVVASLAAAEQAGSEKDFFDVLTEHFGLDMEQSGKAAQYPMGWWRQQVDIIFSKPRANITGCVIDAMKKDGWKGPIASKPIKPEKRTRPPIQEPDPVRSDEEWERLRAVASAAKDKLRQALGG